MKQLHLMVGDYVTIDGTPKRVDAVHQKKVGWHRVQNRMEWARFSVLKPIVFNVHHYQTIEQCDYDFSLYWSEHDDNYIFVYNGIWESFRYVHELQNLVRILLGIEIKELHGLLQ